MPNKTQEYLNLAQQTAKELTRYWENWTDYLTTASRLYKYSFADQLMIYAQRPDATACASFDIWNNRMNRYVRRGSKGIALLDQSSSVPCLHYVFDVSDTGVRRNSRDPEVWQLGPDLVQPVSEMLAREYGVYHERLSQQISDLTGKLVDSYWDNNSNDILDIVDGSFLMDYDEAGQEFQFKSAAAISILYTVLERCGLEPDGHFDRDDFQAIFSFSTPAAVYALGTAVSECSRDVLRNIERTVKTTIRRRNAERSQHEYEQQERDLLDYRGLPAPEPDPAPAGKSTGQIRQTAPDLPDAASPGAVQFDAPVGDSVSAPVGSGADRREPDAADHAGTAEAEPGSEQGAASDGVGAAHEQPESASRGTGADGADLQLSFLDAVLPTEAQQIEKIDRAESEKTPSAFVLSQAEIENALRRGSNVEGSKLRIWKIYQLQPDRKLRAKALAKEYAPYGPGGSSHTYLDGSSGWLDHDSKGLTFEHYPDHQKVLLRWDRVEKYIDLMIQSDRYLSDKERRAIDFPLELNAASAAEYTALKAQHPDTLVGFEAGGNFMFYGEDAAKVAKVLNSALFTRETALGEVQVTGFPPSLWARKSKELWSAGNNVYLAGLNEDGTHHQTKHLHKEDYLPIGSIINMDGRKFRIDGVDFDKGKVSLQDMALADLRISNTFDIVMAVFDLTQKVVSDSSGIIAGNTRVNEIGLSMLEASLMQMDVGPLFGLFLQSFFIGITMRILSIVIFVIVYGRMIEIYCMVSLAPIPMATWGNHEQSHMGQNYLKCLFALGFQGFLILICVAIYAVLIQNVAISGDAINSIWGIVGYTVLLCFSLFKTSSVTKSVLGAH